MLPTGGIIGTVVQDPSAVAAACARELNARLHNAAKPRKVLWVPPKVFGGTQRLLSTPQTHETDLADEFDAALRSFALWSDNSPRSHEIRRSCS
jgi:hypothetical protein